MGALTIITDMTPLLPLGPGSPCASFSGVTVYLVPAAGPLLCCWAVLLTLIEGACKKSPRQEGEVSGRPLAWLLALDPEESDVLKEVLLRALPEVWKAKGLYSDPGCLVRQSPLWPLIRLSGNAFYFCELRHHFFRKQGHCYVSSRYEASGILNV